MLFERGLKGGGRGLRGSLVSFLGRLLPLPLKGILSEFQGKGRVPVRGGRIGGQGKGDARVKDLFVFFPFWEGVPLALPQAGI